jgi:hypothetical protein
MSQRDPFTGHRPFIKVSSCHSPEGRWEASGKGECITADRYQKTIDHNLESPS